MVNLLGKLAVCLFYLMALNASEAKPLIVTNKDIKNKNNRVLTFKWDKFRIGSAEYPQGPTGCTVISFPDRNVKAVADLRGSATGSIFTNSLVEGLTVLDCIVFTGGSLLGLESVSGINADIFKDRNYATGWTTIPYVAGSVIFDWVNRKQHLYPDMALGSAAYRSAETGRFILGKHGVGINATIAKGFGPDYLQQSGQGGAVETFGEVKIAAFIVINALGAIYDEQGKVIHGYLDRKNNQQFSENELLKQVYPMNPNSQKPEQKGNTTLSIIIINVDLELDEMREIARQVHNSFSEVIRPFGTSEDGDTLYLVSTREIQMADKDRFDAIPRLGMLATKVAKKAIYSAFDK